MLPNWRAHLARVLFTDDSINELVNRTCDLGRESLRRLRAHRVAAHRDRARNVTQRCVIYEVINIIISLSRRTIPFAIVICPVLTAAATAHLSCIIVRLFPVNEPSSCNILTRAMMDVHGSRIPEFKGSHCDSGIYRGHRPPCVSRAVLFISDISDIFAFVNRARLLGVISAVSLPIMTRRRRAICFHVILQFNFPASLSIIILFPSTPKSYGVIQFPGFRPLLISLFAPPRCVSSSIFPTWCKETWRGNINFPRQISRPRGAGRRFSAESAGDKGERRQ